MFDRMIVVTVLIDRDDVLVRDQCTGDSVQSREIGAEDQRGMTATRQAMASIAHNVYYVKLPIVLRNLHWVSDLFRSPVVVTRG
jgi:hypothetical protein